MDKEGLKHKGLLINEILEHKIIAICRNVADDVIVDVAGALYEGGIKFVEVTFDQSGKSPECKTEKQIISLREHFAGRIHVGAGTVLTPEQVDRAFKAGAEYIISPDTNPEVIKRTVSLGLVSIPGALTPTEIQNAHACGADFVKLFPAGEMGISYIKAVTAPLNHIRLLAVGGVNEDNLADFFKAGIKGAGIGSNIIKKNLLEQKDFKGITKLAGLYSALGRG
ncbi:MAG: bifunctional 4-hydroxy-2-oxoglutarate aldolase/2-dehydro-3-deoxy-phosphogluconate aldolase [Eubacteriales bacterium]|nr:bifunctional 4-hydroxy-2-oxoglutarate aldolase/2-dehydro-3-deoxy-phosphogluconate aldolase [Eubacteriales bacterium]